jgi:hypothetical protein
VHHCAETFANDSSLPSTIVKALKRTMAAEYSRELGIKVVAGKSRLASVGFKQGGIPGYGLRRMLVSAGRTAQQELASGERKSIAIGFFPKSFGGSLRSEDLGGGYPSPAGNRPFAAPSAYVPKSRQGPAKAD